MLERGVIFQRFFVLAHSFKIIYIQVGTFLILNYGGSFKNLVLKAENSAEKLLNLIVSSFPCFRDKATFKGQEGKMQNKSPL